MIIGRVFLFIVFIKKLDKFILLWMNNIKLYLFLWLFMEGNYCLW